MPNVNGLELLKQYRSQADTANIPVIVLSTREDPKVKGIAFRLEVNNYLVKLPDAIENAALDMLKASNKPNRHGG
jgi:two-component system, chemotaxis family, response regulator WspR